ncbi:hypothetical protein [Paracraurococcus ruber]|uniref:Uncharacterized protein n=1 Tax=Paracraurococcus ruber TaxID=77675 RepID=A0ABS1CTM8_9PROT|nr:hypothetical protein [Paracraurococcus ruber]MBK1657745.1 hypothetical protein [Paracraurococcus ruber]TDG30533.1 hypothetical protein E2C05_14145 [Paracraurococcus ruber]
MRIIMSACALATAAITLASPLAGARADDSDIPGLKRSTPGLERPMAENPDMTLFMTAEPARPAVPAAAPAPEAVAPPPVQAARVAPRDAVLKDVSDLLHEAEGAVTARRLQAADHDLSQAEMALHNALAAGDPLPDGVLGLLTEARQGIRRHDIRLAARDTERAQQRVDAAR